LGISIIIILLISAVGYFMFNKADSLSIISKNTLDDCLEHAESVRGMCVGNCNEQWDYLTFTSSHATESYISGYCTMSYTIYEDYTDTCSDNSHCSGDTPYCFLISNTCVECLSDTHCLSDEVCVEDDWINPTIKYCEKGSICSTNSDCNDGNPCTEDECIGGFDCQHEYTYTDGDSCPGGTCYNGICCSPYTCSLVGWECGEAYNGCGGTIDCGSCESDETCSNGICVSSGDLCEGVDCDDKNLCTIDSCDSSTGKCSNIEKLCPNGVCDPVDGQCKGECDMICKLYQERKDDCECKFSLSKLFTTEGMKAFWDDYTWQSVVGVIGIIIIIGLLFYLLKPNEGVMI